MQLVELVLQGVRRFAGSQKIAFKPGLNVVYGTNESGKTTLADCVRALLYPLSVSSAADFVGWENPQVSRAALLIKTDDGTNLRIIRDFVSGACNLAQHNAQSGKFDTVEQTASGVEAKLRELGTPPLELFDHLYCLHGERMPSGPGGAGAGAGASGAMGGSIQSALFEGMDPDSMGGEISAEEKQQKLENLRKELGNARELEKLQFELDGIEGKKFELQNRLGGLRELEGGLSQTKGELSQFGDITGIDNDMLARIEKFQKAEESHGKDIGALMTRKESLALEAQTAEVTLEPFYKNPIVLGGVIGSLISLGLGIFWISKMVLLLVPALGVGGFGFYLWNERAGKAKKLKDELEQLEKKIADDQRRFEVETAVMKNLVRKLEAGNVEEIIKRKHAARKTEEKIAEIEKQLSAQKNSPEIKEANTEITQCEKRAEELQDKISQYTVTMDAGSLEREVKRLEAELAGKAPATASALGGGAPLGAPAGSGGGGSGVPGLLAAGASTAGTSSEELAARESTWARLAPFTGGRHAGGHMEGGALKLATPGSAQPIGWESLSASTRDAAYLAVALGIAQELAGAAPFVWDDVAANFDEERLSAVAGALKTFARERGSQALWLTSRRELAAAADHLIKLAK